MLKDKSVVNKVNNSWKYLILQGADARMASFVGATAVADLVKSRWVLMGMVKISKCNCWKLNMIIGHYYERFSSSDK